jgi:uncharacterized DUF497 family protein
MDFTYDATENEQNRAKHGLSLSQASELEWEDAVVWQNERRAYGEVRMCGIAYIGQRLFYVAF